MTKAEIVSSISEKSGIEKGDVLATVEAFMDGVKDSLENGENVYLRGFGSFIIKKRAEKTGRNMKRFKKTGTNNGCANYCCQQSFTKTFN